MVISVAAASFEDYPPLPTPIEPRPLHSRVSSFPSRSSTPRVPPGFETHAHPIHSVPGSGVATPERKGTPSDLKLQRAVSGTVLPAVPDLSSVSRVSSKVQKEMPRTEKLKQLDLIETPKSDISLGSPLPKGKANEAAATKEALSLSMEEPVSSPSKKAQTKSKQKPSEPPTISAAKSADTSIGSSKDEKVSTPAPIVLPEASRTESPRPSTPATSTSEAVPGPRPRTLRLTTAGTTPSSKPPSAPTDTPSGTTASNDRSSTPASTASVPVRDAHHFPQLPASRQPSISSIPPARHLEKDFTAINSPSRPSTPMSEHSAYPASVTTQTHSRMLSEVASRSSTPPPSGPAGGTIVGSAPERTKTKNQLKKERREKAKVQQQQQAQATQDTASIATSSPAKVAPSASAVSVVPPAEEVGPIVAKQKKQKKEKARKPESAVLVKEKEEAKQDVADEKAPEAVAETQQQPVIVDSAPTTETVAATKQPETPSPPAELEPATPTQPCTLSQLYSDATAPNAPTLASLLAAHAPSAADLLASLSSHEHETDELSLKEHPFLNPPSFSSKDYRLPSDSRKGQDYLDAHGYTPTHAFGYLYVPRSQRRELIDGGFAVGEEGLNTTDSNTAAKEDLLKSYLIAPSGTVLRHLSSREIDRVLDLEDRRLVYREQWGDDLGSMQALEVRLEDGAGGRGVDFINLEGGVEELVRHGEGKGVVWVREEGDGEDDSEDDDDLDGDLDDEDEEFLDDDEDDDIDEEGEDMGGETDEEILAHGDGRKVPADGAGEFWEASPDVHGQAYDVSAMGRPTTGQRLAARSTAAQGGEENNMARERRVNVRALDNAELQKRTLETQRENEASRKEVERLEKGLGKRNREMGKWREMVLKSVA